MDPRRFGNYSQRARLGLIVPPTNTVNEAEWMRLLPEGVTLHVTRMPLHADSSSEGGRAALYADIRTHVLSLAQAAPDVIAYGCTAGSMVPPTPSSRRSPRTSVFHTLHRRPHSSRKLWIDPECCVVQRP